MEEKTLLLVCEGPTDFYLMKEVAKGVYGSDVNLNFCMLQPQKDATSGTHEPGGWTKVIQWCFANREKYKMMLDFQGAELLFIQMDTDIAGDIDSYYQAKGQTARECCEIRINTAMGTAHEPGGCSYVLPTEKTETWLLATHDHVTNPVVFPRAVDDYEVLVDVDRLLIGCGYAKNKGKLRKSRPKARYTRYGKQIFEHLGAARPRCSELDRFCSTLEAC